MDQEDDDLMDEEILNKMDLEFDELDQK